MNIKIDEIENTQEYLNIKEELEKQIYIYIQNNKLNNKIGACHYIWEYKKELLKMKYNIDWKSPAELNPEVIFD